jgi:hypothetical protein
MKDTEYRLIVPDAPSGLIIYSRFNTTGMSRYINVCAYVHKEWFKTTESKIIFIVPVVNEGLDIAVSLSKYYEVKLLDVEKLFGFRPKGHVEVFQFFLEKGKSVSFSKMEKYLHEFKFSLPDNFMETVKSKKVKE